MLAPEKGDVRGRRAALGSQRGIGGGVEEEGQFEGSTLGSVCFISAPAASRGRPGVEARRREGECGGIGSLALPSPAAKHEEGACADGDLAPSSFSASYVGREGKEGEAACEPRAARGRLEVEGVVACRCRCSE
mmetsp:Transcript_36916/g.75677  ORF Transcript_36916/g.75677 Transcript_36916/m.75677 type:complete len:134 (+) Transcript_36916:897-1298(+)